MFHQEAPGKIALVADGHAAILARLQQEPGIADATTGDDHHISSLMA